MGEQVPEDYVNPYVQSPPTSSRFTSQITLRPNQGLQEWQHHSH